MADSSRPSISIQARCALALACLAVLNPVPNAAEPSAAPSTPAAATNGTVPSPTDTLTSVPRNAYENTPAVGIPMRSIFKDTRAPYYDNLRDWTLSPSARLGESVGVTSDIDLPDFRGGFPMLQRGFAPEEADLKLGPIYFKLRHVSVGALYSDNIEQTDENRESDVLGIASIGGQVLAQLSEGFQIAVAGNYVFFPFEGESGARGFALRAPYSFGITSTPTGRAQVTWEPVVFGLPLTIADEVRVGLARFSNGAYDGFSLFDGYEFDEYDRAGVYTFRGQTFPTGDEFRDQDIDEDTEFLYYSNEISLSTGTPLPGQNLFTFRASHENIWYDGEEDRYNLPTVRDRIVATVQSVRENLRFKPYVQYEFFHRDEPETIDHTAWLGVKGPVTDLMYFRGAIGALWRTEQDSQDVLWRTGLYHTPSPYTWHSLEYYRDTSDFHDELEQRVIYRINKTLGPEITGTLYASYNWIEDSFDSSLDREEKRGGVRFTYIASPKTSFRLIGEYAGIEYDDGSETTDSWRGRFEVAHRFYERFTTRAIYQYEQRDSDRESRDYYENMVYLTLSWVFD